LRFTPEIDDWSTDKVSLGTSLFPSDAIFTSFVQPAESENGKNTLLVSISTCFSPVNREVMQ
jgi:hypothetical protein